MPATTIMDFKSQFSKGFARPNLFRVNISMVKASEQFKYQMGCFQAQIPGHNIATTDKDIGKRSVAYQKIFSDVILGFYVSANLTELKFWQAWIDRIVRSDPNRHNYYDDYIGTIKITQINRYGEDVATWTLHDAYPKQIDPIQLDYGTNDAVMTCNATITYRHFTVEWLELVKDDLKTGALYTHNTRTDINNNDNIMTEILDKRESWKFGRKQMSEEEFMNMYPAIVWDNMSRVDQQAARKLYGLTATSHGDSMTGGAFHMVAERER